MISLYAELADRLRTDSTVRGRNGPRADIGMLLFAQRDDIRELWTAADRLDQHPDPSAREALHAAMEKLRPLFGER